METTRKRVIVGGKTFVILGKFDPAEKEKKYTTVHIYGENGSASLCARVRGLATVISVD